MYFPKQRSSLHPILAVLDVPLSIDCTVNNKNVKVSLFKKTSTGKVKVVPDGKAVKRRGNIFTLIVSSYGDAREYYCHGEIDGNVYEETVRIIIVATSKYDDVNIN